MAKNHAGGIRIPIYLIGGSFIVGAALGVVGCGVLMVGNWLIEATGRALETEVDAL